MKARLVLGLVLALALGLFLMAGTALAAVSIEFDQCANGMTVPHGACTWIGSNINLGKGDYSDGMAVPQRIVYDNIPTGATTHTLAWSQEWTNGSKHTYDWLVSWDQAQSLSSLIRGLTMTMNPCDALPNTGGAPTVFQLCQTYRAGPNVAIVQVPDNDPFLSNNCDPTFGSCVVTDKLAAFEAVYGNRTIRLWADQPITAGLLTLSHVSAPGGSVVTNDSGNTYVDYTLVVTTTASIIGVEFAGHIGLGADVNQPSSLYWGAAFGGASVVPGSSYHFKKPGIDGTFKSQDNQVNVDNSPAVPAIVTKISQTALQFFTNSGVTQTPVTDTVTITGTSPVAGQVTFYVCGPTASAAPCTGLDSTVTQVTLSPASNITPGTGATGTAVSPAFTPTAPGTYCFRAQFVAANASNSSGSAFVTTNECVTYQSVTAVRLSSFGANTAAEAVPGQISLAWKTATEINTAGFNLYRSDNAGGPYVRINAQLIPASSDALVGGKYLYADKNVEPGRTYYYQLEDVELNGRSVRHSPVAITASESSISGAGMPVLLGLGAGMLVLLAGGLVLIRRKKNAV